MTTQLLRVVVLLPEKVAAPEAVGSSARMQALAADEIWAVALTVMISGVLTKKPLKIRASLRASVAFTVPGPAGAGERIVTVSVDDAEPFCCATAVAVEVTTLRVDPRRSSTPPAKAAASAACCSLTCS